MKQLKILNSIPRTVFADPDKFYSVFIKKIHTLTIINVTLLSISILCKSKEEEKQRRKI